MNQPDPQRRIAGGVEYELTRRRVRNLNIRVRTDGSVAVSAPRRVPLSSVDAFAEAALFAEPFSFQVLGPYPQI